MGLRCPVPDGSTPPISEQPVQDTSLPCTHQSAEFNLWGWLHSCHAITTHTPIFVQSLFLCSTAASQLLPPHLQQLLIRHGCHQQLQLRAVFGTMLQQPAQHKHSSGNLWPAAPAPQGDCSTQLLAVLQNLSQGCWPVGCDQQRWLLTWPAAHGQACCSQAVRHIDGVKGPRAATAAPYYASQQ